MQDFDPLSALSRRRFLAGAGGLFVLGAARNLAWAQSTTQTVLSGTEFNLEIGEIDVNFTGNQRRGTVVNGQIPAPLLRWREGDTITLRVSNRLPVRSSIHWHGMIVPADMDGVPGLSFDGIPSGGSYVYRFKVNQYGTYWYHAHSRFQEQTGLYGPIVISRRGGERQQADREYVILLSDWTDIDPERIYSTLKKQSTYFNFGKRTVGDLFDDARANGWSQTLADRRMWGQMRMNPTDLLDVSGYAYTYLMNGVTPASNWMGLFNRGERVRLRFINGSAMSIFDVRIPGLKLTVVAADGQDVEPVTVDEFRIAAAETYDVIVEPKDDRAYTIFAQAMDRTGYARGTLTPHAGMTAEIPPLDPRPLLTMSDMGMSHEGMSHGGMDHGAAAPADHSAMNHGSGAQPMDHSAMDHGSGAQSMDHSTMDHGSGAQPMDHSAMNHGDGAASVDHAAMGHGDAATSVDHAMGHGDGSQAVDHAAMGHGDSGQAMDHAAMGHGAAGGASRTLNHAPAEASPTVDMRVDRASTRLDDPGVGLRNNGRRVLTYADLRTIGGPIDRRDPGREIELHLTGHMERFIWSFNGQKFSEATPLRFNYGERLRITLVNDTMMTHPIHLHGMWSEIETPQGEFQVRKHTIIVNPAQRISYAVTADALGRWAYHCHLLYHMEAGMFREVHVAPENEHGGDHE